jgi:uncharacterized protein (DUF305 family)
MKSMFKFTIGLMFVLAAAGGAVSFAQMGHRHGAPPMSMGHGAHEMSYSSSELEFLVHMIPHHQEAVDSSMALLEVTTRPELRAFLEMIIEVQLGEIALMEAWLDRWYPDASREGHYHPMMRDLGPDASVAEVEQAWLEDMIMHHMMAVHEAQILLAGDWPARDDVTVLAREILTEQMREIMTMRIWLMEWFGVFPMMSMDHGGSGHAAHGDHDADADDDADAEAPPRGHQH